MSVIVNTEAIEFARDMIRQNRVNNDALFRIGKNERDEIKGDPAYWLATNDAEGNLIYPIGKNGKLYIGALQKIKAQALENKDNNVAIEAEKILKFYDGSEEEEVFKANDEDGVPKMDQIVDILSSKEAEEHSKSLLDVGDFVAWRDKTGILNRGRIIRTVNAGSIDLPDQSPVRATEDNPALLVRIYKGEGNGFRETEILTAIKAQEVDPSSALPPPRELQKRQWAAIKGREIDIYGEIGGFGEFSALNFVNQLKDIKGPINVNINSYGGDVFEGVIVRNALKARRDPVNIMVAGVAASIASYILTGGDHVSMPSNAAVMVHEPWAGAVGKASDMFAMGNALLLAKRTIINGYVSKSGLSADEWEPLVERETWMDAARASELKLIDSILDGIDMAACVQPIGREYARNHLGMKKVPNSLLSADDKPNLQAAKSKLSAQRILIHQMQTRIDSLPSLPGKV